jgi:transposase-like protein
VRRLEVFTGGGRQQKWSDEDKARIVAEIVASGDSVCPVARRHGLSSQKLFDWRKCADEPFPSSGPLTSALDWARSSLKS